MALTPNSLRQYHVFLASPGDVAVERQAVRKFFDNYNRSTARIWNVRFDLVDWENYSTVGVGRPQELITRQTLEKYQASLALVIGIMAQRFGSPSGKAESGTEEEFNWAMESHRSSGFPEIKWFFRRVDKLEVPSDPDEAGAALDQWKKVCIFRKQMQNMNNPVFYAEYPSATAFSDVFACDLHHWLADSGRPWAVQRASALGGSPSLALPVEFDSESYRLSVLKRYDKLNFEMLDTTGSSYNAVRLWSVFVAQSVRECHQYNPRLLEIPKEHQHRLVKNGDIRAEELEEAEKEADQLRKDYFRQPLRPVLDVVEKALSSSGSGAARKIVFLGDPGSGKSSLLRYLAVRWAGITDAALRDAQPIPLVVELGAYGRWRCDQRKDFVQFLEEAPGWYSWTPGLLASLLVQPGRFVLLLDGLDEVFDAISRAEVIDDIQRFSSDFPQLSILVTSRVVGYHAQRLRDSDFNHFMLQDLGSAQITDFLQRWHEETFYDLAQAATKRERLQKAVRESKSIALLAGNPLLLTMMAILNRNQELPRDRSDLYAQASRVLLHQWDTERALKDFPGIVNDIGLREKSDILRLIAAHMQAAPGGLKGNLIDGPALTNLIEGYLQGELHILQSRAVARTVVEQLRLRNFILCFAGADSYAFVHRTFLEYFCATEFVHQFNVAKSLTESGLVALFDQHCCDDEWCEVLRLICGQIDEQFVGQIVDHLASRTDLEKWDGIGSLPEIPLAIYCMCECRNLSKLQSAGRMLMSRVIQCLAHPDVRPSYLSALAVACQEIGPRWPGKEQLRACAISRARDLGIPGSYFWPYIVAAIEPDRDIIIALSRFGGTFFTSSLAPIGALRILAETWPDQATRELLTQRAVQDEDTRSRSAALEALAKTWPDQATRELLTQRACEETDASERGKVCFLLGAMHSGLGRILMTRDLDGLAPYLDPIKPIPRKHFQKAAAKVGIPRDHIDDQVASLSAHMGWDIMAGVKKTDLADEGK